MNEISRSEELSLSGAALRGAPWKAAAVAGGAITALSLLAGLLFHGLPDFATALGRGIGLFSLVAAIGAVANPKTGDRTTRQARQWALRNPWKFALLPAGLTAVAGYPVQLLLGEPGIFSAAWSSLWHGGLIYVIVVVATLAVGARTRSAR